MKFLFLTAAAKESRLTFCSVCDMIIEIQSAKARKRKSSCGGNPREKMVVRIFMEAAVKQSRSCRPKW